MDSGASASIIHDSFVRTNKFHTRKTFANKWFTIGGSFSTLWKAEVKIKPPELNLTVHIFAPFHVTSQKSTSNCDVIFGRPFLRVVGISPDFQKNYFGSKINNKVPMKLINCKMRTNFAIQDSQNIKIQKGKLKRKNN